MLRVTFVIDGFNLYHSIRDVERETGVDCRRLDLRLLCATLVKRTLRPGHAPQNGLSVNGRRPRRKAFSATVTDLLRARMPERRI